MACRAGDRIDTAEDVVVHGQSGPEPIHDDLQFNPWIELANCLGGGFHLGTPHVGMSVALSGHVRSVDHIKIHEL